MDDLHRKPVSAGQDEHAALKAAEALIDRGARHGRNRREVFRDFVDAAFFAIFAQCGTSAGERARREAGYMEVVGRYGEERSREVPRSIFPHLLALLDGQMIRPEPCDFFGSLATRLEVLSARDGQFFTPMSISQLTSGLILPDDEIRDRVASGRVLALHEPACGSGGMILAMAGRIRMAGGDPERMLSVHAVDISPLCFRMCAVQMALARIPARVFLGNGLDPDIETSCRDQIMTPAALAAFGTMPIVTKDPEQPSHFTP